MIQYNNFLIKREQSRAGSSFAECEKSRLKAKILTTLALLLTAVTGAWAQSTEPTEWDLTSQDGKTWTLAKMPASEVELQVEYYAESNLFLSGEALANKANIAVKNGETAVAFDEEGKSTTTVTEGNTVTATYTGTKKVIGMKVAKKVSLVYPIAISEVTSDYIGSVVTTDGNVYATVAAATAASKIPVAMIAYVGTESDCAHGLAIALADESGTKKYEAAGTACIGKIAVIGGTWRLPSIKDWQYMFIGCGASGSYSDNPSPMSYSGLTSKLTTVQGDALQGDASQVGGYWSSTESTVFATHALVVVLDGSNANFYAESKDTLCQVRACLVF